jgi:hypothetical protein
MRFQRIHPDAPAHVFVMSDRLQMPRVYAASNAAEMINLKTIRDVANQKLVGDDVGDAVSSFHAKAGVSVGRAQAPHPNPASGFGDHFHLGHKSFKYALFSHATLLSCIGQGCAALITLLRPASILPREVLA